MLGWSWLMILSTCRPKKWRLLRWGHRVLILKLLLSRSQHGIIQELAKAVPKSVEPQYSYGGFLLILETGDPRKPSKTIGFNGVFKWFQLVSLLEWSASQVILGCPPSSEPQILRPQVQDLLPYGFAVHHAGLPRADRKLVEETSVLLGSWMGWDHVVSTM